MKLGEGLQERAGLAKRINDLRERATAVVTFTEGEDPAEDIATLMEQASTSTDRLRHLIASINRTNARTLFDPDGTTITDALATRDAISTQLNTLDKVATAATGGRWGLARTRGTELKTIIAVNVPTLRERIEQLTVGRRELDARLQQLSWETDLIEVN